MRLLLLVAIALMIGVFFTFDLGRFLTLEYLQSQRGELLERYHENPFTFIAIYMAIYIAATALSLPGATIMTLAGAAVFGLAVGTVVVSFASTIGATLAFLVARFLLRDAVQSRFADKLGPINAGVEKDGVLYLFTLRLIPIFPFFMINLLMGLTPIKTWKYFLVSQVGMLPGTIVYVNAGDQLASLESLSGILSPGLLLSFALLGIFPLLAKKLVEWIKAREVMKPYKKPSSFDYNLVVIGGGSAGLVSAYIAAAVKAKVALIERHKMGGDCLNTGCVPSKALIRSAKMLAYAARAEEFGFKKAEVDFEFAEVMERVQRVITEVEPHDSVERYNKLGVECISGDAKILSPYEVEVEGRVITTRTIIVATGARPLVPQLPGLEGSEYHTSDTIWELREQPKRLVVLGGGPIGCELAQAFHRLGSQVTLLQRPARILPREDEEISAMVAERFSAEGVELLTAHSAKRIEEREGQRYVVCEHNGEEREVPYDQLLIALGRQANVQKFGLEKLGVTLTPRGTVEADPFLRTNFPNIYVCGDVTGPYQFTHTAAHQAWYASVNALFSPLKRFRVDYSVIPWATYCDPEVARVGLNELEGKEKGIDYEVTTYGIDDLDRAIADSEAHGVVKVLTVPGKDKILGVTIVGSHAGDLIAEFVMAMKHGLGLNKILGTIHIYPTLAEANKYVAGNWKRAHKPEALLNWVERFHTWRRG
ncbi:pyridine nucleotide-disulfide oxidoreductase [Solemya pervernicosa gill symbiont]|uniref:Pyridine nucleotide-disulfide oxidoreductase n=2 Tax=Solemya pervernicosa gill symbiont TaxID=642797 RepID=A0A1T2L4K8_9GAMM|nr:pyridine nucleotide-disulfide oxidoreductase [Solemya pervernicosa gill symbiont]